MSKFAAALKAKTGTPVNAVSKPESQAAEAVRAGARKGAKHIGGYFTPAVSKQLQSCTVVEDTTVQDLPAEALNLLFQRRHLPMIAAFSREQAAVLTSRKPPVSAPGDNA
jgi:hypothetical protein